MPVPFNYKMLQSLLRFILLARLQNLNFYSFFFLSDGAIFSGLAYKANTRFIPVFCFSIL